MANDLITFYCYSCGIKLTVPRELAGVEGPCPSCGTRIQAPNPAPVPPAPASQPAEPVALKPEPRQLPARVAPAEVVARPMPEPLPPLERRRVASGPKRTNAFLRYLSRFLMLLLFIVASGALVYGVLTLLESQQDPAAPNPPAPAAPPAKANNAPSPEATAQAGEANPQLPDGLEPVSPWKDAEAVLEKFLAAKSLPERLPIIECRTSGEELASSCLARPLPAVRKMIPELRETNPVERVVDCYFSVEFEVTDRPSQAQTILVRTRGSAAPLVVADPFLDTYGGRLAAYASKPSDKGGVFQVVVYAVASCTDPSIPNREKKLTLKLLSSDNTREIASAYFGRQSKISEMLEDGNYSLNYGNAKACTVMLRWNTEDNPGQPYLEAIAIKSLDWNS